MEVAPVAWHVVFCWRLHPVQSHLHRLLQHLLYHTEQGVGKRWFTPDCITIFPRKSLNQQKKQQLVWSDWVVQFQPNMPAQSRPLAEWGTQSSDHTIKEALHNRHLQVECCHINYEAEWLVKLLCQDFMLLLHRQVQQMNWCWQTSQCSVRQKLVRLCQSHCRLFKTRWGGWAVPHLS